MSSSKWDLKIIFTQKFCGESWGNYADNASQISQSSGFIDLDKWIFFNLINPENWYWGKFFNYYELRQASRQPMENAHGPIEYLSFLF